MAVVLRRKSRVRLPRSPLVMMVVLSLGLMGSLAVWMNNECLEERDRLKPQQSHTAAAAIASANTISQQQHFYETAMKQTPTTDKVTTHSYHQMYGTFLMPLYESYPDNNMRMLEVGLGCDMSYGPGASVKLWKELFPRAEIWAAEYDRNCVQNSKMKGQLDGIHVIIGDQGDNKDLGRWIEETGGGHFDVVIDDGGHANHQIKNTFDKFWPVLNPGGLYFIEDLQVGRNPSYRGKDRTTIMSEVVQDWIEQLIYSTEPYLRRRIVHPLPADVAFVACQSEACVVGKIAMMMK